MIKPKVFVLKTAGTNCDEETRDAFNLVGADAEIIHLADLRKEYNPVSGKKPKLAEANILVIPGGFSNGDYIRSGKIFAEDLKHYAGDQVREFVESGKPVIGICNGFQVLVNYGLLPSLDGKVEQQVSLTYNDIGRFRCDWVRMIKPQGARECLWTTGVERIDLPMAHGEGKFVAPESVIEKLFDLGLVQFQYANVNYEVASDAYNPNGSMRNIAGICNERGNVFGLMPHPERYLKPERHRLASLQKFFARGYVDHSDAVIQMIEREVGQLPDEGPGMQIFRNAVNYVRQS